MFDPSKLDLDLDNTEGKNNSGKNNSPEKKEEIIENIADTKQKPEENTIETPKNDNILGDLPSSETKTKNSPDEIENHNYSNEEKNKDTEEKPQEKNQAVEEIQVWRTDYEKSITEVPITDESKKTEEVEERIVFDINVTTIDTILSILTEKDYDFATFEPNENHIKIVFRKNKVVQETRYIKFPVYTNILLKAKSLTKLTIEETENQQEWEWEMILKGKNYKVITKVVPSNFGSKLFIKAKRIEKKVSSKEKKKTSLGQIFTCLWIIGFIALIIWGWFIGFVVLNAKTVEDVKFFYSLWINLNDINTFILQAVTVIFSILIFIETLFLIVYLFKFSLTKKEFKQKKIRYWIISAMILIITFTTGSAWLIIDKKIRALPNWQEMAYWDIQLYDNSKLLSDSFTKETALLKDTSNLIWPVEIKFDLSYFVKKEERKRLTIKKYTWDFWNDDIIETPVPTIIYNFKEKWNYEVKVTLEEVDIQWKIITKKVDSIPNVNVWYSVKINEKKLNNWWKLVDFNASSLKELGKIEWYFMDDLEKPVWKWDIFRMWKPIFKETIVWMYIRRNDKTSKQLDKLFIISWEQASTLNWKITYTRNLENDLKFELKVENLENDFWNWIIEEFKWIIWDKEITKPWNVENQSEASKINFEFKWYWKQEVKVILTDSSGETKEIKKMVEIPKILKLSKPLKIYNDWKLVENLKYQKKLNEYYINEIWIPTTLTLDARFVKSSNLLYTLKKVDWDYNSDWDIDASTKTWKYEIDTEWNHTITVYFEFVNRRVKDDKIVLKEVIYIEWIKKEAILKFDIKKNSTYVPVIVGFDASKSQVKNEDISKFIWDYWDWVSEERDAIVPGHRYTNPWDYEVSLKVITVSWKEYSISKKLILKPKPQSVKITTSLKKAPTWQWIDFTSEESEWQIVWYFWDFWDGGTSTQANPTHSYRKVWKYKVKLKIDFSNKNILEDIIEVEIVDK